MFHLVENGTIKNSSTNKIQQEGATTLKHDFTEEEKEKIELGYTIELDNNNLFVGFSENSENLKLEKKEKTKQIKEKYNNIIYKKYSMIDQINLSAEALMIIGTAQGEGKKPNKKEKARFSEIKEGKLWIKEQRRLCQEEIKNLVN